MDDFFRSDKEYGEGYKDALLSQYNLFLNMLDNLISRRTAANNFFLSVNTGLLALLGILFNLGISSPLINNGWVAAGSGAGIIFAYAWFRTIRSYTQLSKVKWDLVWQIEERLPMQLHKKEWKMLGDGKNPSKYRKLTDVERIIPIIFLGIYTVLLGIVAFSNFDREPPLITFPTAAPNTLGPGQSKISVGAHVTDNVGATSVYIGVYEKGKTDATIDGVFYGLGPSQGNNKNGQYVGDFSFPENVPDGKYDVRFFAKDAAQNQATPILFTVTLDRVK